MNKSKKPKSDTSKHTTDLLDADPAADGRHKSSNASDDMEDFNPREQTPKAGQGVNVKENKSTDSDWGDFHEAVPEKNGASLNGSDLI